MNLYEDRKRAEALTRLNNRVTPDNKVPVWAFREYVADTLFMYDNNVQQTMQAARQLMQSKQIRIVTLHDSFNMENRPPREIIRCLLNPVRKILQAAGSHLSEKDADQIHHYAYMLAFGTLIRTDEAFQITLDEIAWMHGKPGDPTQLRSVNQSMSVLSIYENTLCTLLEMTYIARTLQIALTPAITIQYAVCLLQSLVFLQRCTSEDAVLLLRFLIQDFAEQWDTPHLQNTVTSANTLILKSLAAHPDSIRLGVLPVLVNAHDSQMASWQDDDQLVLLNRLWQCIQRLLKAAKSE